MAIIKTLKGMPAPRFGKHCYFSEGAVIVGDVEMGDDCTVWFNAVIRGDVHFVKIGNRTNVQDNSCIHTLNGKAPCILGDDPTYAYIEDGRWPNSKPYGTIHRIGTDGAIHGAVQMARDYALQFTDEVRADTHADNKPMQHTLTKNGFVRCGIIYLEDGAPRIAYQYSKE